MKKLLLIFTLLFSTLVFSSPSYADWTKVGTSVDGDTFYVDFDRIRKHGGYVYFWQLSESVKPVLGDLSAKFYIQGDCKLFRFKYLSYYFHTEPMGNGTPTSSGNTPDKEWRYPSPNSSHEDILKSVCNY